VSCITDKINSIQKNLAENGQMTKSGKNTFKPQLYTTWNYSNLGKAQEYPGNLPPNLLENLVWKYTKPFDVVCDRVLVFFEYIFHLYHLLSALSTVVSPYVCHEC